MTGRRKARFVTVVWGGGFTRHFMDVIVPTQLSDGNIPAFTALHDTIYTIYCPARDAELIRRHAAFKPLSDAVRVELRLIEPVVESANKYRVMTDCHHQAIRLALAEGAAVVPFGPDAIVPDGSFRSVAQHYARGRRLVVVPSIRLAKEPFLSELKREFFAGSLRKVTLPPRDLVRLSLRSLHPAALSYCKDSRAFKPGPAVFWRVGGEGFVGRYFHMHPLLIHPTRADFESRGTIDDDFVLSGFTEQDLHVVTDSDEAIGADSCDAAAQGDAAPNKFGPLDVALWGLYNANARHRRFFSSPVRVHAGELGPRWKEAQDACDAFGGRTLATLRCLERLTGDKGTLDAFERAAIESFPNAAAALLLNARRRMPAVRGELGALRKNPSLRGGAAFVARRIVPESLRSRARALLSASALKGAVKRSPLWGLLKHLLPRYFLPHARLALAKARARVRPGPASETALAKAHLRLAGLRVYANELELADASCLAALARDPRSADALLERGNIFTRRGMPAAAVAEFRKALALAPDRADIRMALGYAVFSDFENEASADEALSHYRRALELEPESSEHHFRLGGAYHLLGLAERSERAWAEGLRLRRKRAEQRGLDRLGLRVLSETWFMAVGHLAMLDAYFKMGQLGLRPKTRTVFIPRPDLKIPNPCLFDYWRPFFEIVPSPAALGLSREDADLLKDEWTASEFADGTVRWSIPTAVAAQTEWDAQKRPPLLSLTPEHGARGRACLERLGVPKDAWYVCLHVRETGFHENWNSAHPATRDADIADYDRAIRAITGRGGWVIRMGDASMKPLPPLERAVDYAHSALKSDWMDVFLAASCRFCLGTNSGFSYIPPIFGVPCALTNWAPMGRHQWFKDTLWIPKLNWLEKEGRRQTFDEMLPAEANSKEFTKYFAARGIRVDDNTPEELEELVVEMLDRSEGRVRYDAEDDALQERFRRIAARHGRAGRGRMGRAFLRRNEALLGPSLEISRRAMTPR